MEKKCLGWEMKNIQCEINHICNTIEATQNDISIWTRNRQSIEKEMVDLLAHRITSISTSILFS